MVRAKDVNKINKILVVLLKNPEGLWIRQIAKETNLALPTVHYYINKVINEIIENIGVKDRKGRYFGLRIIKLKPKIKDNIEKNGVKEIINFLKMSKKI